MCVLQDEADVEQQHALQAALDVALASAASAAQTRRDELEESTSLVAQLEESNTRQLQQIQQMEEDAVQLAANTQTKVRMVRRPADSLKPGPEPEREREREGMQ